MRVNGIGMTLHGPEGAASPPLPFIEVDDIEGATLIALYPAHVAVVSDATDDDTAETGRIAEVERLTAEWAASEEAARIAAQAEYAESQRVAADAEVERQRLADDAKAERATAEAADAAAAAALLNGTGISGDAGDDTGKSDLIDAIDLLGTEGLLKTGPRKGKPKVEAVVDILGRDVTAEEIDAAIAAKDATA